MGDGGRVVLVGVSKVGRGGGRVGNNLVMGFRREAFFGWLKRVGFLFLILLRISFLVKC